MGPLRSRGSHGSADGHAEVRVSSDGAYASIVWPQDREYSILAATGTTGWTAISSGSGVAVAWALSGPIFAVLHIPQVGSPLERPSILPKIQKWSAFLQSFATLGS